MATRRDAEVGGVDGGKPDDGTRGDGVSAGQPGDAGASGVSIASLARRFGALMVDWALCVLVAGLIGSPRQYPWGPQLVLVLEYGLFIGVFGQTPGMFVAKIRCVALDGGPIGVPRALLRAVLLILVVPALIMDGSRRGLHDRAAGSIVVGR